MARLKGKIPYEALYGQVPKGLPLHIWGTTCYAHVPKGKRANPKSSERAIECKMLGLSDEYKGYRLLDVKGNRHFVARDIRVGITSTDALIDTSFPRETPQLTEAETDEIAHLGKRSGSPIDNSHQAPSECCA